MIGGIDCEGIPSPADYDWYPRTKNLDQCKDIGEGVVWEIGEQVEVFEDLLDDDNEELTEIVREAGASYHSKLRDEIIEDYEEARGSERGEKLGSFDVRRTGTIGGRRLRRLPQRRGYVSRCGPRRGRFAARDVAEASYREYGCTA